MAYARLRAIETRRSIGRSANTGISAFINQRGDVTQKLGYWEPGGLYQTLNANSRMTFYVIFGNYIARISSFITVVLLLYTIVKILLRWRKH
jgi:apolipoprotein N-acyltransferase